MELILSLLLLGAVFLMTYVVKAISVSKGENGGKPVLGEGFPTIDILQPETETQTTVPCVPGSPKMTAQDVLAAKRIDSITNRLSQIATPVQAVKKEETAKRERLVVLNSKSDAKRAFIYSEIFNRKY